MLRKFEAWNNGQHFEDWGLVETRRQMMCFFENALQELRQVHDGWYVVVNAWNTRVPFAGRFGVFPAWQFVCDDGSTPAANCAHWFEITPERAQGLSYNRNPDTGIIELYESFEGTSGPALGWWENFDFDAYHQRCRDLIKLNSKMPRPLHMVKAWAKAS